MEETSDKKSLKNWHDEHREEQWLATNWRSWGSWFSWGSPVGLGLFFISIGVFLVLLHLAGLWK